MTDRLSVFTDARVDKIRDRIGPIGTAPWPTLAGCLTVLFTARSGSTYLSRELEYLFEIGRMGESLNPEKLKKRAPQRIVKSRHDHWFAFKAGFQGVIAAELCGFFDAYLDSTVFILLARRDIVAQAVSMEKASQTGLWHASDASRGAAVYHRAKIAKAVEVIAIRLGQLRQYAQRSGRPWGALLYEDFSSGDFSSAVAGCEALGVPHRKSGSKLRSRPVEKAGDAINDEWIARFQAEMTPATRDVILGYQAAL